MSTLLTALIGLQIGVQLTAAVIAFLISMQKFVPHIPYRIATLALLVMTVSRLDYLVNIYSDNFRIVVLALISILWLFFFSNIYVLVRNK